jgi:hypothetical protein
MPEVPITQNDIDSVAQQLDTLSASLSEAQRALLVGLVGVAQSAISGGQSAAVRRGDTGGDVANVEVPDQLPDLGDVFRSAFTPGPQGGVGGAAAAPTGSGVKWSGTIGVSGGG